jgi:glucan phosphoethanolaminetransferase (alkaline phosphatase superfamily)
MANFGLNFGNFVVQILSWLFILGWLILSVVCLINIRKRTMTVMEKAIWTLIIVAIPLMGAIAYLIVKPAE